MIYLLTKGGALSILACGFKVVESGVKWFNGLKARDVLWGIHSYD